MPPNTSTPAFDMLANGVAVFNEPTQDTFDKFELFSKLPVELRLAIWALVAPASAVIVQCISNRVMRFDTERRRTFVKYNKTLNSGFIGITDFLGGGHGNKLKQLALPIFVCDHTEIVYSPEVDDELDDSGMARDERGVVATAKKWIFGVNGDRFKKLKVKFPDYTLPIVKFWFGGQFAESEKLDVPVAWNRWKDEDYNYESRIYFSDSDGDFDTYDD
ncbi:hypothetical protein BDZ45DRAFT_745489 [Acephala macrosclerotiorum]|nr:hypothetical protein BDZ45DRAFT_745489 [Acephala macrosclerotiorum]